MIEGCVLDIVRQVPDTIFATLAYIYDIAPKVMKHPGFREDLKLLIESLTTDLLKLVLADVPLLVNTCDFKDERDPGIK